MPAGLPPAPWLQPPQTAQHYTQGYGLGLQAASDQARINQQQAALAQQAQQTQMEMQQRSQEKERQFLMEQQQMEIGKQYHQMQMSLSQQKLEEQKSLIAEKTKAAALQAQARMGYDQRIKAIQSDGSMSPDQKQQAWHQAVQEFGPGMSGAAGLGSLFGAMNKMGAPQQASWVPADTGTGAPGHFNQPSGNAYIPPGSTSSTPGKVLDMDEYKKLQASNIRLKTTLAETKDKGISESLQAEIAQNVRRQRQLQQSLGMIPPTTQKGTATPSAAPAAEGGAPSIAGRYVDGKLIMTPKPDKGKVTIGGPQASAAPAEPQGPAPGGLSIGGMSIGGGQQLPTQASLPPSMAPAPAQPQVPEAPGNEEREFGKVYQVTDGPLKGRPMQWGKDDWGHGQWQTPPEDAPEWLQAVGGTLKKAAEGLTSGWGD